MKVLFCGKVFDCVSVSSQYPLGREQSLDSHGSSGVDPPGTNTDLCTQPEPVAVGESRAGVVKDTGTVHTA